METAVTDWKWVRIPGTLHERLAAAVEAARADRARTEPARMAASGIRYYEVVEMALNALERERDHGVDTDSAGSRGGVAGDAGGGDVDRVDSPPL